MTHHTPSQSSCKENPCTGNTYHITRHGGKRIDDWKYHQHQFITHLQDNKSIEEALEAISK